MAALDNPQTLGRARLSFASELDIDEFAATLNRFERGEISPDEWRRFRLVRGTYGQRQTDDAQMIRVKIPQGLLSGDQLAALADVAEQFSRGFGHITTRQNVQFHFVRLHDVEPAMRRLAEAGLTTREACGNSVRNITACPYAGVSASEPFDVTPYSEALTRYFLRHPLSSSLPRKFKIAFEGCADDHIKAAINDIGWLARVKDGRHGFRVLAGGGTATLARSAAVLFEFLPAGELLNVAEAIVRVFRALGDYQHKQRNRMKFLIRAIGWDAWREAFDRSLTEVRAEGGIALPFDPDAPPIESAPGWPRAAAPDPSHIAARLAAEQLTGPGIHPSTAADARTTDGYTAWTATNVRPQRQRGFAVAVVTVPLGDLTTQQMRVLRELSAAYSDGTVRVTPTQNVFLRWVPTAELPDLHIRLHTAGLGLAGADTITDVTSCPGAESCKLAVTQSRGLGRLLETHMRSAGALTAGASSIDVKISGCPNGCGQHHIAAVGFQGSLRKLDGRAVPQYFVMAGGGVTSDGATFGRLVAKIPARRSAAAIDRLGALFAAERNDDETAAAFFNRIDLVRLKSLLADLEPLTAADARDDDFVDLGESTSFTPQMTDGECAV